jgi:uncharacterized RDD family membrane protein YckC
MSVRVREESRARAAGARAEGAVAARRTDVQFERLRAPFSLRCGAVLVDYVILIGIVAFATLLARLLGDTGGASFILTVGYLTAAAVAVLNFGLIVGVSERTLGKWVAGLRIERRDGEPLSFARALLRHLVGYPLTLLTFGVGFLLAAFHPQGRALHDLLAGTVVVRSRSPRR